MNGNSFLLDTNIVLYLLGGDDVIATFLQDTKCYVSVLNELELLGFPALTDDGYTKIKSFLNACTIVELNENIKSMSYSLRKMYKLKLPDSIVAATAIVLDLPFVSADTDFNRVAELHFILYNQ